MEGQNQQGKSENTPGIGQKYSEHSDAWLVMIESSNASAVAILFNLGLTTLYKHCMLY